MQVARGDVWIANAVETSEKSEILIFFGDHWQVRMWVAAIEKSFFDFLEALVFFQVNMRQLDVVEKDRKLVGVGTSSCLTKVLPEVCKAVKSCFLRKEEANLTDFVVK